MTLKQMENRNNLRKKLISSLVFWYYLNIKEHNEFGVAFKL